MITWIYSIVWLLVVGGFIASRFMKASKNKKALESGEDKEKIRKAVLPILGGDESYKMLYGHWEDREHYGRRVRITYHHYAIVYGEETLYAFPLFFDKKTREVQVAKPSIFTPDRLGKVEIITSKKDGAAEKCHVYLSNKQGEQIFEFVADAKNTNRSKYYPVNVLQWEECDAFDRFMTALAQRIDAENPGVDALIKANNNAGLGYFGAIVSVIGAVIGLFMPPAGAVLALIGLIMSIVSKARGAKSIVPLIISILCMLWCGVMTMVFFTIMY